MTAKPYIIALEEHYQDAEVKALSGGPGASQDIVERLDDLGTLRLKEMDEAGIDLQVLSHSIPGLQGVDAERGVPLAQRANDRLRAAVQQHPDRFSAFAALPTADPRAAADELERTVTKLGFKGAMINGMTDGVFHDDRRFWPIYERAQALDVPIYIHPALPHRAVIDVYYKDYAERHPGILRAAWGFTVETATQGIRFVLSGMFDAYPGLKIILGHMGEGLPMLLWRISYGLRGSPTAKPAGSKRTPQ
jgi:2,3-dihydroxybenzoate decarboxylase